jgi:hypothetical protein
VPEEEPGRKPAPTGSDREACIHYTGKDNISGQEDLSLISNYAWSGDEVHTGSV